MSAAYQQQYSDEKYLRFDFWGPEDSDKQCMSQKLVVTRKEHTCHGWSVGSNGHVIPKGTKTYKESGKVEGQFGSCFVCLECFDKAIWEVESDEHDEPEREDEPDTLANLGLSEADFR